MPRHASVMTALFALPPALLFGADALAQESALSASPPLAPFTATYSAYYQGKNAGDAKLQVTPLADADGGAQWTLDLDIHGHIGFLNMLAINVDQSTTFAERNGRFVPLAQSTTRRAFWSDKKMQGAYDWNAMRASWDGDLKFKKERKGDDNVPLQPGDLSALLLDLSVIRDAAPGKQLNYRVVDYGKARQYAFSVSAQTEIVAVNDLSYDALRVARSNGGKNEMIFWIASGVPTPVRILQRKDGEDFVDLHLVDYTSPR